MGICHGLEVSSHFFHGDLAMRLLEMLMCYPPLNSYALQWLFALPLEIIAGALTIQYWNHDLSKSIFVTIFLFTIVIINLCGIKAYGEAEFLFSTVKVTAIVGFM